MLSQQDIDRANFTGDTIAELCNILKCQPKEVRQTVSILANHIQEVSLEIKYIQGLLDGKPKRKLIIPPTGPGIWTETIEECIAGWSKNV